MKFHLEYQHKYLKPLNIQSHWICHVYFPINDHHNDCRLYFLLLVMRHLRNNSKKGLGDLLFIVCSAKSNGDKQLSHQLKWQCVYCRVIALLSHLLLSAILSKTYIIGVRWVSLATAELPRSAMNFPAQYNRCKSQDHSYLSWMGLCSLSLTATAS